LSRKGKAGPYAVWLMDRDLKPWLHHNYGKLSEAMRVAKKRKPMSGWAFVKDVHGTLVWGSRGLDEITVRIGDVVFDMLGGQSHDAAGRDHEEG